MVRAPSGLPAGVQVMGRVADLTPCTGLSGTRISHKVTSEWETPKQPTGKWLMRGPSRPIMRVRAHPRETGRRHRDRRNPSVHGTPAANWERPD